jgi:hypothetical protein
MMIMVTNVDAVLTLLLMLAVGVSVDRHGIRTAWQKCRFSGRSSYRMVVAK